MQEIYWLGPAPADEDCVQIGHPDYARSARAECKRYIGAIRTVCGPEPAGARLTIKAQPHDLGSYLEVAVVFDGDDAAACAYAAKCDASAPKTWAEAVFAGGGGAVPTRHGRRHRRRTPGRDRGTTRGPGRGHLAGDWGDVDPDDAKANEEAMKRGERILSSYRVNGEKLWVLTAADRSATTVLTPDEY